MTWARFLSLLRLASAQGARQFLLVLLALMLAALMATFSWFLWNLRPVDRFSQTAVSYELESGQGLSQAAAELEEAGAIRSRIAFLAYVTLHGLRSKLQAGPYEFKLSQSTPEIAKMMAGGKINLNLLVVPEGSTLNQIKKLAAQKGLKQADLVAAWQESYSNSLLQSRPAGSSLEGYLFPDSYKITPQVTAHQLTQEMLDNFERKITAEHQAGFARLGLSLHQGITLASIVEREVSNREDRAQVAQVFLKRLEIGQALESDPTYEYAASLLGKPADTGIDSPYNTYRNKGLPPGPICNPGLDAIEATIHPADTDYLYFVSDRSGRTYFARTFAEHEENIRKYRPR